MASALAIQNVQKHLGIAALDTQPLEDTLEPGYMRLYDCYQPALENGVYSVEAKQEISSKDGQQHTILNRPSGSTSNTPTPQLFEVTSPRFSINPKLVNSHYPPDGHQENGTTLPHIVLNDPHLPWSRKPSNSSYDMGTNKVPWLALMVFNPDELKVSEEEASALHLDQVKQGPVANGTPVTQESVYGAKRLPSNGAYGMTVKEYLTTIQSRVYYEAAAGFSQFAGSTESTSIIFPRKSQVQAIFDPTNDRQYYGIQQEQFLSHVRLINIEGAPDKNESGHGYFSVVLSGMTGDIQTTVPVSHVVHLVSIEHIDATMIASNDQGRIGLVSLFSWTYQCIPKAIGFEDRMKNLGSQAQALRAPKEILDSLEAKASGSTPASDASKHLNDRLKSGYTICRWRAPSGEESVAFNRGPLSPKATLDIPSGLGSAAGILWPRLSMTGKDYLIFDKSAGMLDATYSGAWSFGKLMAISDSVFNAALLRFRSLIWRISTSRLRLAANDVKSADSLFAESVESVSVGKSLAAGNFEGNPLRLVKPSDMPLAPRISDPRMADDLAQHIERSVFEAASTSEKPKQGLAGANSSLYNGFDNNNVANTDWSTIFNWLYNALFLGQIPIHVLFPDPSYLKSVIPDPVPPGTTRLQPEALRFFHIDHSWVDAFIDGALSCANHVEPQYDTIRLKMKTLVNLVLKQPIGSTGKLPPVPRYGFVIRSEVVRACPDLKLTARRWKSSPDNAHPGKFTWVVDTASDPLVRHSRLDDFTILSLLDCAPEEIAYIEWNEPPHQQKFALPVDIGTDATTHAITSVKAKVNIIKLYTNKTRAPPFLEDGTLGNPPDLDWKPLPVQYQFTPSQQSAFYDMSTRCIRVTALAEAMAYSLQSWGTSRGTLDDFGATSSMFGVEMNDRAAHYRILGQQPSSDVGSFPAWVRQLWTEADGTGHKAISQATFSQSTNKIDSGSAPNSVITQFTTPPVVKTSLPKVPSSNTHVPSQISKSPVTAVQKTTRSLQANYPTTPYSPSTSPQFELLVHPDYRPPPPRPEANPSAPGTFTHSVVDWIPSKNDYLFDLVISIRRRRPREKTNLVLRNLYIEIPISRGSLKLDKEDLDGKGHLPREPLITAGSNNFGGTRIASNPRFLSVPFNSPGSATGDGRWDGWPVLLIELTPRSGKSSGTIPLLDDDKTNAVTVRVSNVVIAETVTPVTVKALIKGADPSRPKEIEVPGCGTVPVRLTEKYMEGEGMVQWSYAEVIKRDIKDSGWNGR